jgi:hypothetical protein
MGRVDRAAGQTVGCVGWSKEKGIWGKDGRYMCGVFLELDVHMYNKKYWSNRDDLLHTTATFAYRKPPKYCPLSIYRNDYWATLKRLLTAENIRCYPDTNSRHKGPLFCTIAPPRSEHAGWDITGIAQCRLSKLCKPAEAHLGMVTWPCQPTIHSYPVQGTYGVE